MDLSSTGKSFQNRGAAAEKDQSPQVFCRVINTTSVKCWPDLSALCGGCLTGKFARCEGVMPCNTLNVSK